MMAENQFRPKMDMLEVKNADLHINCTSLYSVLDAKSEEIGFLLPGKSR